LRRTGITLQEDHAESWRVRAVLVYLARMIIGHLGVAFAARARWPRISVYWLIVATMAPDLLRAALAAGGMSMAFTTRYSHLLPWSAGLALALGALAFAVTRRPIVGVLTVAVVLSHILLDAISGAKALWDGGPAGLNVQRYQQLELVIEAALCWGGWRMLRRSSTPTSLARRTTLAALLAFETIFQAWSLNQRPYATRCWVWPLKSCWEWRGEKPPAGG
jgi:hypothetical protein